MIAFEPRDLFIPYQDRNFDEVSRRILQNLDHLRATPTLSLSDQERATLNRFVNTFLTIFVQPDYVIPDAFIPQYITHNVTIANIVSLTPHQNTDPYLGILQLQTANYVKMLTLYNGRSTLKIDRKVFFDIDPRIASLWWCQYAEMYRGGFISSDVCGQVADHFNQLDDRFILSAGVEAVYFGCTYADGDRDRIVKTKINACARRSMNQVPINPRPNPRKIAVMSDCWKHGHSVHRTLAEFVRPLRPDFHVTGIRSLISDQEFDASMFDATLKLEVNNGVLDVGPLQNNEFAAIYYPDIGMTAPSIMLSNIRVAPLQLIGTGHPVSTWGSQIDYFVGGQLTDRKDNPEQNYSERLLLLPGYGAVHQEPKYQKRGQKKAIDRIVVNCPAYAQKVNPNMVKTWARIVERTGDRLCVRLFAGGVLSTFNAYLPFLIRMRMAVKSDKAVEVVPNLSYDVYMQAMEEGDLACDSFHFGGSNSVADSLHLRKPIVCLEGKYWYCRIGPAMLRDIGLENELVAKNEDEYVDKIVKLVTDDKYRAEVTKKLEDADLRADVFSMKHADSFRESLKFLIDRQLAGTATSLPSPLRWPYKD
jgi:hypothetical protein